MASQEEVEPVPWRDVAFAIGRRRYDTEYSVAWRSLFATFVPIERAPRPAHRLFLRDRAGRLRAVPTAKGGPDAAGVTFETMLRVIPSPVPVQEFERPLRAHVGEIPDSVIRAISAC